MVNYLARLGWSHGDDEIFSRAQFLEWFNLDHLGRSAAQFDEAKLKWVNAQHLKAMADDALAPLVAAHLQQQGITTDARLPRICGLFKDRCDTTVALAQWAKAFYADITPNADERAQHITDAVRPVLRSAGGEARGLCLGQGQPLGGHQGSARRARPEDAATGHAGARAGDGHGPDAVARCGARTAKS